MKQIITVRAIIKQDQKILFLRRSKGNPAYIGLYELPGGKVDEGEDPQDTLRREVVEETGRQVETLQLFDVRSEVETSDSKNQYIILIFLVTLTPPTAITLSDEHDKYAWVTKSEIQLNELTPITRISLELEKSNDYSDDLSAINRDIVENSTSYKDLIIYTDGGSRGNPGPSASGFVLQNLDGDVVYRGGKYLGVTTNNQAEYQAVKAALEKALSMGAHTLSFRLDSQLVVNQLNGLFQIKNRDLWPIHSSIKDLITHFSSVTFTHVRREFNQQADAVVNQILDEQAKH